MALAAAVNLSMDACRLFTHKIRKELRQLSSGIGVVTTYVVLTWENSFFFH